MCPDHDDGLVARGAAFATTGRLPQAMQDLSRALNINPQNENASTYLKETRRCDMFFVFAVIALIITVVGRCCNRLRLGDAMQSHRVVLLYTKQLFVL